MNSTIADHYLQQWNDGFRSKILPNTCILSIQFVIGLTGNCIVLFVYTFRMNNGKEDRYVIPYLACLDILAGTFGTTVYIFDNLFWVTHPSNVLCKVLLYLSMSTSGASAHTLLAISLSRYLKICKPHGRQMTITWQRFALILISASSMVYSLPLLYLAGTVEISNEIENITITGRYCAMAAGDDSLFKLIFYGILLFLAIANLIITAFLYTSVSSVIYKRFKLKMKRDRSTQQTADSNFTSFTMIAGSPIDSLNPTVPERRTAEECKVSKASKRAQTNFNIMFMVIVCVYVLTYIPTFVFLFLSTIVDNFWFGHSTLVMNVYSLLGRLYLVNHIVNPYIYGYFDFRFREEILRMFRCKLELKTSHDLSPRQRV